MGISRSGILAPIVEASPCQLSFIIFLVTKEAMNRAERRSDDYIDSINISIDHDNLLIRNYCKYRVYTEQKMLELNGHLEQCLNLNKIP